MCIVSVLNLNRISVSFSEMAFVNFVFLFLSITAIVADLCFKGKGNKISEGQLLYHCTHKANVESRL